MLHVDGAGRFIRQVSVRWRQGTWSGDHWYISDVLSCCRRLAAVSSRPNQLRGSRRMYGVHWLVAVSLDRSCENSLWTFLLGLTWQTSGTLTLLVVPLTHYDVSWTKPSVVIVVVVLSVYVVWHCKISEVHPAPACFSAYETRYLTKYISAWIAGFYSWWLTLTSVYSQPATQGQLSLPSLRGR